MLVQQNENQQIEIQIPVHIKAKINEFIISSKKDNTRLAYKSDWNQFVNWCRKNEFEPLPATVEVLSMYVAELSDRLKFATIKRHVSSISVAHNTAKKENHTKDYTFALLMDGIANTIGKRQTPKKAIILDDLRSIISKIDACTMVGKRDKALILIGFAMAGRRSEIVSINAEDTDFTTEGVDIYINKTKTDNEGILKSIVFANNEYCPVIALREWMEAANIHQGAVFKAIDRHGHIKNRMTDKSVAIIIKKYAELAGLDPNNYAGHSLRSGLATSAAMEGMNDASIMKQTGHNTRSMVDRYVQRGKRYQNNASSILRKI